MLRTLRKMRCLEQPLSVFHNHNTNGMRSTTMMSKFHKMVEQAQPAFHNHNTNEMEFPTTLRKLRKMGCLEQPWTVFHNYHADGMGSATLIIKIDGLSRLSDESIQTVNDKIHAKYEPLQSQILINDDSNEYDMYYVGTLAPKIKRYTIGDQHDTEMLHNLMVKCLNFKFKLLNDYGFNEEDAIKQGNYNLKDINPLYFRIIYGDYMLTCYSHATMDMPSEERWTTDFVCLLNQDDVNFDDTKVLFLKHENCIEKKYANPQWNKEPSHLSNILNWIIPSSLINKFFIFYANNSILSKYNPLSIHNDMI
eukprot:453202_1